MKYFLSFIISLAFFSAFSQNFYFLPDDSLSKTISTSDFSDLTIHIDRNPVVDTLHLEYELLFNSLPAEWSVAYCDNHGCWGSLPENGTMSPLYDDLNSFIRLTIHPSEIEGNGIVQYYIYEPDDYTAGSIMTFVVQTPLWLGLSNDENTGIKMYSNPFRERLVFSNVKNIKSLEIMDLGGKIQPTDKEFSHNKIVLDTESLKSGMYIIQALDNSGKYRYYKAIKSN